MYVLGVSSFYHDSAACLLKDGKVVGAAQEERFSRTKHDSGFPYQAIEYCLKEANISPKQIDRVGFYEKPYVKFERLLYQFIETFPFSLPTFTETMPVWLNERLNIPTHFNEMKINAPVSYINHHLSHASATFFPSPFDDAAILSMDGVGEWATTSMGIGKQNNIELLKEIHFPHSIGLLYSAITAYLGFSVNNSEYKVMGLAPYGKPRFEKEFNQLITVNPDSSFSMNMKYFAYHYKKKMISPAFEELFGAPTREKESKITQFHMDVAASLQQKTEEIVFGLCNELWNETHAENLCLGGGVALNSVANGKILSRTKFKRIFIQPAAGDAGSAMGVALFISKKILKEKTKYHLENAYLGPHYSDAEIVSFLEKNNINYEKIKPEEVPYQVAKKIYDNKVVGFFHGRMEWGPRSLGARSILANPCDKNIKSVLNEKVKHREHFRPFAPVIPYEDVKEWFICDDPIPEPADYMLMVYPIRKEKQKHIPGVTHVDGSGRLQVIRKKQNDIYYQTIREFEKLSGVPILINTSFNIRGEPIVCTPADAYRCMSGTGIDYLSIGSFLITRAENNKDWWDSEVLAID